MTCTNPILLKDFNIRVPCRKCMACRIKIRTEWAVRILHESVMYDSSLFLTFTYDDKYLPSNMSIDVDTLNNLVKRLRKRFEPRKLRYFACGEYGTVCGNCGISERDHFLNHNPCKALFPVPGRPHYHMILFGVKPCLECEVCRPDLRGKTHLGKIVHPGIHPIEGIGDCYQIDQSWPFGFVSAGSVNVLTARYVAKYIEKQLSGDYETAFSKRFPDRIQPFSSKSRGLGGAFLRACKDHFEHQLYTTVNGKKVSLPKYYINELTKDSAGIINPEKEIEIKERRQNMAIEFADKLLRKYKDLEGEKIYPEILRGHSVKIRRYLKKQSLYSRPSTL